MVGFCYLVVWLHWVVSSHTANSWNRGPGRCLDLWQRINLVGSSFAALKRLGIEYVLAGLGSALVCLKLSCLRRTSLCSASLGMAVLLPVGVFGMPLLLYVTTLWFLMMGWGFRWNG
ncbi:hypothetical protein Nepgr_033597 [Nepenthes gracilis]|uniref:Uncharacterized protein n=1 Tax=Nepenthes gracilis TaxID=150966 RepID=A0AAD3Y721_NEPGR|nr:hypothetical protein Nepgr_033597 [Nepenthes gracilis]